MNGIQLEHSHYRNEMIENCVFRNCPVKCYSLKTNQHRKSFNHHETYLVLYFESELSSNSIWLLKSTVLTSAVKLSPKSLISRLNFSTGYNEIRKCFLVSESLRSISFGCLIYRFLGDMRRIIDFGKGCRIRLQNQSLKKNSVDVPHLKIKFIKMTPLVVVNERDRSAKPPVKLAGR